MESDSTRFVCTWTGKVLDENGKQVLRICIIWLAFKSDLDQSEPGVRDNALRFGYYAASVTLRCGS
jgi:hypothetical protein